mmetsp:Transcript_27406/g.78971  ORF Transcript_27406/g.78971 Transcript_27406/m.78971 type:complete len:204 (+) Transcript_27406:706-1317(+)
MHCGPASLQAQAARRYPTESRPGSRRYRPPSPGGRGAPAPAHEPPRHAQTQRAAPPGRRPKHRPSADTGGHAMRPRGGRCNRWPGRPQREAGPPYARGARMRRPTPTTPRPPARRRRAAARARRLRRPGRRRSRPSLRSPTDRHKQRGDRRAKGHRPGSWRPGAMARARRGAGASKPRPRSRRRTSAGAPTGGIWAVRSRPPS